MRKPQLGVVMDPIAGINPAKDSSLAMLVEAQRRGYALWYFEQQDLRLRNGVAQGSARALRVDGQQDRLVRARAAARSCPSRPLI